MAKGFALVKGSEILEVLVGAELKDAMAKQIKANKYSPLVRVQLHACSFDYLGMGKVANVKIGKRY